MDELVQNLAVILGKCVITYTHVEKLYDGYQIWISGEDYSRTKEIHDFLADKPIKNVSCGIYPQSIIDFMVNKDTRMQIKKDPIITIVKSTKRERKRKIKTETKKKVDVYEDIYTTIRNDTPAVPYLKVNKPKSGEYENTLDYDINNKLMFKDEWGEVSPEIIRDWIRCLLSRKKEYIRCGKDADVEKEWYKDWETTMLSNYVSRNAWTFVKIIINEFPELTHLTYKDKEDALLKACKYGQFDLVKYFIEYQSVAAKTYHLYRAITGCLKCGYNGNIDIVKYILDQPCINVSDGNNQIIRFLNYWGKFGNGNIDSEIRTLITQHPTYVKTNVSPSFFKDLQEFEYGDSDYESGCD